MWQFPTFQLSTDQSSITVRPDGRKTDEFRDILINWNSIETANGSAIIKLGNTTVISGVVFERTVLELNDNQTIEQIEQDVLSELSKLITIDVKFQPHCSFSFKMQGIDQDTKESLLMTTHFKQILKNAKIFDLKQLIKVDDQKVIINKMCIEILIEDYDGNGFDASNLAMLASIIGCKLDDDQNLKIDNYPISTTFAFKSTIDKDDNRKEIIFQDPNLDDEKLSDGIFNVVVNADTDQLILLNKSGGEGIDLKILKDCIRLASKRSNRIKKLLKSKNTKI